VSVCVCLYVNDCVQVHTSVCASIFLSSPTHTRTHTHQHYHQVSEAVVAKAVDRYNRVGPRAQYADSAYVPDFNKQSGVPRSEIPRLRALMKRRKHKYQLMRITQRPPLAPLSSPPKLLPAHPHPHPHKYTSASSLGARRIVINTNATRTHTHTPTRTQTVPLLRNNNSIRLLHSNNNNNKANSSSSSSASSVRFSPNVVRTGSMGSSIGRSPLSLSLSSGRHSPSSPYQHQHPRGGGGYLLVQTQSHKAQARKLLDRNNARLKMNMGMGMRMGMGLGMNINMNANLNRRKTVTGSTTSSTARSPILRQVSNTLEGMFARNTQLQLQTRAAQNALRGAGSRSLSSQRISIGRTSPQHTQQVSVSNAVNAAATLRARRQQATMAALRSRSGTPGNVTVTAADLSRMMVWRVVLRCGIWFGGVCMCVFVCLFD